ncbi:type II toxin-antitoxin system VapC family toxin [Occultella glacieicola]|uniref:Type II toxin-antitoxin system VapC family toxin n=1 Tax=Occultella glacieicola TaxID=2518684 RepID=A0ABY2E5P8_9MICO|nr:type II toxin-antitoxin system VapC family toxin [Occultella glacieicola]
MPTSEPSRPTAGCGSSGWPARTDPCSRPRHSRGCARSGRGDRSGREPGARGAHPNERRHAEAVDLLSRPGEDFLTHSVNLAEVLVLAEREGHGEHLADDLAAAGIRSAETEPLRLAGTRVRSGLRMPDSCALSLARAHGVPVATFDGALGRAAVTWVSPPCPDADTGGIRARRRQFRAYRLS